MSELALSMTEAIGMDSPRQPDRPGVVERASAAPAGAGRERSNRVTPQETSANSLDAPKPPEELPYEVLAAFLDAMLEAVIYAADGNIREGHEYLAAGLRHAREAHARNAPWGEELVARYEQMLARYDDKLDRLAGRRFSNIPQWWLE
jgi:hypothetical protein